VGDLEMLKVVECGVRGVGFWLDGKACRSVSVYHCGGLLIFVQAAVEETYN
jgi:hypothetical protein